MLSFLLAAAPPDLTDIVVPHAQSGRIFGLALKDALLVMGVLVVLALILFGWVYFTRRDPRRNAEAGDRVLYRADQRDIERSGRRMKRRKKRAGHPETLPRNPTLAEAGGLPPIRQEPPEPA